MQSILFLCLFIRKFNEPQEISFVLFELFYIMFIQLQRKVIPGGNNSWEFKHKQQQQKKQINVNLNLFILFIRWFDHLPLFGSIVQNVS